MRKSSTDLNLSDQIHLWHHRHTDRVSTATKEPSRHHSAHQKPIALTEYSGSKLFRASSQPQNAPGRVHRQSNDPLPIDFAFSSASTSSNVADDVATTTPPPAPPPGANQQPGTPTAAIENEEAKQPQNVAIRFYYTSKMILLSSWINVLLIFVPVGIALGNIHINPTIVFAINAVAIIPLAGLLSFATESVARRLGDTVGALMNVTFGNAVELIIFIALVKNEIRIVQASLLGSILSNLLLILGMCFLFGGLRYREQIYNSAVTQMSACLLSLSVMSLLLPTAFHASFTDGAVADKAVLQVSRGTSIILLLVYGLYLLFQLKSHAYIYESTPQNIIDEESHPGVLARIMDSSSDSDSSSSSTSSNSDDSSKSNSTAKRIRKVIRGRRRRKSTASSKENKAPLSDLRTQSPHSTIDDAPESSVGSSRHQIQTRDRAVSGDEADTEPDTNTRIKQRIKFGGNDEAPKRKKRSRRAKGLEDSKGKDSAENEKVPLESEKENGASPPIYEEKPGLHENETNTTANRRPFNIRKLTIRPALEKLPSAKLSALGGTPAPSVSNGTTIGLAPYGLRRTASLPDRLNRPLPVPVAPSARPLPHVMPTTEDTKHEDAKSKHISRTSAIILLLITTALVALCAEYLVDSINYLVANTGVSEAFVGLIILPIIGNAAEHVCAVTVASKNKMDLAIGVAVGSSIQIALFVTPIVVLLGWILHKDMSLYFSLFETISLFVAAFIVNFLVLDGRSNYLEGALLCAAYVIIAILLSRFFAAKLNWWSWRRQETHVSSSMIIAEFRAGFDFLILLVK